MRHSACLREVGYGHNLTVIVYGRCVLKPHTLRCGPDGIQCCTRVENSRLDTHSRLETTRQFSMDTRDFSITLDHPRSRLDLLCASLTESPALDTPGQPGVIQRTKPNKHSPFVAG
jgi:hypothetical protein